MIFRRYLALAACGLAMSLQVKADSNGENQTMARASASGMYETVLSRYAPYRLARSDVQVFITRYDKASIDATDEALIQLAFLVISRRKQGSSSDDSADGVLPAAFKLLTEQTGMFLEGDLATVKINEQLTQVVASHHDPYQFRAYVLLHEVFGHGALLGEGEGVEKLQQVLGEIIGAQRSDPLLSNAAASVFHESFADVLSVLLWAVREDSYESFLDMVFAFRRQHARPISDDCHDTLASLNALSKWLLRGKGPEEVELLKLSEPNVVARRIHRLARDFSEAGLKEWLLENGVASAIASDAVSETHRLYQRLDESGGHRTPSARIEYLDAGRIRLLVSQTRLRLSRSEPTKSTIVR